MCLGSFQDPGFLTEAMRGARAAFVLTPLDTSLPDLNAEQRLNVSGIVESVRRSGVRQVVALRSWGAEVQERIGGVIACRWLEEGLDSVPGLAVAHLRPPWFMENFLWNLGLISSVGINGLAIDPDVTFPVVAAPDIAVVAAELLGRPEPADRVVRYVTAPREYTMVEATRILGAAIGRPTLRYVRLPDAVLRKALIDRGGLSPDAADLALEIQHGINDGRLVAEPAPVAGGTDLERFAATVFAPAYRQAEPASLRDRLGGLVLRTYLSAAGHRAA